MSAKPTEGAGRSAMTGVSLILRRPLPFPPPLRGRGGAHPGTSSVIATGQ